MITIKKQAIVLHTRERMFDLIDQVEDYPNFLPWCGGIQIHTKDKKVTRAKIQINYKGIKQSFTTENQKQYPEKMTIKLIDGPFKILEGKWQFLELEAGTCKIEFELHYQFSNIILDKLISPVFNMIANTFIDNFIAKANKEENA
jgi:ribosome-associated toxin RatA of RatAB toxin-antitoxin module